jgi:hypothetical protein
MGKVLKIAVIVLAVVLLAVVVMDARACLDEAPLTNNLQASAGALSSCVRARLEVQQGQLREQVSERMPAPAPTPAP